MLQSAFVDSTNCSGQRSVQQTRYSTAAAQMSPARPDLVNPSRPDVVYAQIDPGPEYVQGTSDSAVASNVVYSDLHSTDVAAKTVATPSDLYAKVQKRR